MQKQIRLLSVLSIAVLNLFLGIGYASAQTQTAQPVKPAIVTTNKTDKNPNESKGDYSSAPSDLAGRLVRPPVIEPEVDPTLNHEVFEDFLNGSNYTPLEKINQLAYAGGGTGQGWGYSAAYEDAWGVIEARHGTGSNSRLDLVGKTPNMHYVAIGMGTAYEYQVRFNFANLSTPTDRYVTFDGFFDGDNTDPEFDRGILFRYSDDINEGRFQVVIRQGPGVETLIDTGIAPVVDTWYRFKVTVNATGTEALFFVDGELVATATDLAVGAANRYTAESNNDRLSGTTSFVSRRFDYVRFRATSGRASRL